MHPPFLPQPKANTSCKYKAVLTWTWMLCGQMSKHSVVKHRQIFLLGLVWVLEHHCNSEHDRKKVEALPTPPPSTQHASCVWQLACQKACEMWCGCCACGAWWCRWPSEHLHAKLKLKWFLMQKTSLCLKVPQAGVSGRRNNLDAGFSPCCARRYWRVFVLTHSLLHSLHLITRS